MRDGHCTGVASFQGLDRGGAHTTGEVRNMRPRYRLATLYRGGHNTGPATVQGLDRGGGGTEYYRGGLDWGLWPTKLVTI